MEKEYKYLKDMDYKLLESKTVYEGKRLKVEELSYYNKRDDKKIHREHVLPGDAAVILAITKDNYVIMEQEPRTAIGKVVLGLPAGQIEPGEDPKEGAIRELEEETGYRAKNIQKLREFYPSVGYSNEKITIFLATDLEESTRHLDPTEDINVVKVPLEEVKELLKENEIITAAANIALMHYLIYVENK